MKYMLMIYTQECGWDKLSPEQQQSAMAAYGAYIQALSEAGALIGNNRLTPSATATTVRVADGKTQVLDGPFSDSKEQLAGYFLIEAPDLDAAIAWAARCPGAQHGTMEVRAIPEMPPKG
jgi:hypothetical protein